MGNVRLPRRRTVPAYKYGLSTPLGSKRRSASFQNQGFLDANSARDTRFRVSALLSEWQWQRM